MHALVPSNRQHHIGSFMISFVRGSRRTPWKWRISQKRRLHDDYWLKRFCELSTGRVSILILVLIRPHSSEADFTRHPLTVGALETVRLVRYQQNPANWGPGKKAPKRKRSSEVMEEPAAKHWILRCYTKYGLHQYIGSPGYPGLWPSIYPA